MEARQQILTQTIRAIYAEGFFLDSGVLHAIGSIGGIRTPQELAQILSGPLDHESETIGELVFFPDLRQQMRIEPLFDRFRFEAEDVDPVIDRLGRQIGAVPIHFPGDGGTCRVAIPPGALRQFIRRLNIVRVIDPRILNALETRKIDPTLALRLRITMRNARFGFSEAIVAVLIHLMAADILTASDFPELFAFTCDALEQTGPETDLSAILTAKRCQCAKTIRRSGEINRQMSGNPVEALMMSGLPLLAANPVEAYRHIGWIDRIRVAVYGRIDPSDRFDDPDDPVDLGVFGRENTDIEAVIKILS